MRELTPNTQTLVDRRLGTEPLVIIKVEWTSGTRYYSDKSFILGSWNVEGKIYDFSTVSGQLNDKSYGQVQSASVTLSDIDGSLKNLFDTTVVEQRPVTIYHHYEGLTVADLVPILNGKVVSNIAWNEGDRRFSFEINAEIDSEDLLLEIHEGCVDFPAEEDVGKALPLCFGTPLRVPGVELQLGCTGELLTAITSWTTWYRRPNDPSTSKTTYKSTHFHVSHFEDYLGQTVMLEIDGSLYYGSFNDPLDATAFNCLGLGAFNTGYPITCQVASRSASDYDYTNINALWVTSDEDLRGKTILFHVERVYKYVSDEAGGRHEVNSDTASMPNSDKAGDAEIKTMTTTETFVCTVSNQDGNKIYISQPYIDMFGHERLLGNTLNEKYPTFPATIKNVKGKTEYEWSMLPVSNEPLNWSIAPGAKVRIYDAGSVIVVNSVISLEIHEVMAKRKGELVAVPSSYFDIFLDYPCIVDVSTGITEHLTVIKFKHDLDRIPNENWDGSKVYVSLTSSIADNTISDAITWIMANRITGLIGDTITFTAVSLLIENYPSHFAVLSQVDALSAIKDFAWQARVGIYIEAGIAYAHYLSIEPTSSVYTANISKIQFKSMNISKTSTDSIYTKFTGLWNHTYEEEERKKAIYELNKTIYTKNDYECTFSIYNIESLVKKSARFWSYRMGNVWIKLKINTFLTSLTVQMWDTISVQCDYINSGVSIFGVVDGIDIDTATHQITLNVWLPIKQGEGLAYLDDSADVKPPNPALGLALIDYVIPADVPRLRAPVSLRKVGPVVQDDAPGSYESNADIESNRGDVATFRILEVFDNVLKCVLTNPDNPKEAGKIVNPPDPDDEDTIFWIAKYSDGNSGSLRVMDWHGKVFPDGIYALNPSVLYTRLDVDRRRADGHDIDGNDYAQEEIVNPPYRKSDSSFTTVQAKYYPDGLGLAHGATGKIYWLEISHRAWAKKDTITI